jgi:hypothetical protein
MAKVIYEDEKIRISDCHRDYDMVAYVENKTYETMTFAVDMEHIPEGMEWFTEVNGEDATFVVKPRDWTGFLMDDENLFWLHQIVGKYAPDYKFEWEDE